MGKKTTAKAATPAKVAIVYTTDDAVRPRFVQAVKDRLPEAGEIISVCTQAELEVALRKNANNILEVNFAGARRTEQEAWESIGQGKSGKQVSQ